MRASDMNMFVGARTFAIAMLYFYVLVLSIVVVFLGVLPRWLVAGGWVLLFAVLCGKKYSERENGTDSFVGVGTFAIAILYFYVLTLSIVVLYWGLLPGWFIVAGWVLLCAVLYSEKYVNQKIGQSAASELAR
jgi:hypothetical protein